MELTVLAAYCNDEVGLAGELIWGGRGVQGT
jgi:hypothetical protein